MRKVPKFLRQWCKGVGLNLGDLCHYELQGDPDWEEVHDGFVSQDKYHNVCECVLRHVETGRCFRFLYTDLPYGIEDYGDSEFESEELSEVVEVFPVQVTVTQYLTRREWRQALGAGGLP